MPKCQINDIALEVPKGTTIISAFKKIKQEIAHYCWHPGLSVAGVCRLCMVDIKGVSKLQIACNTEVQEGMVISNQTQKVKEAVRWGLEFHLINHPLDCPICDQAGECELQDQYMKFGKYRPGMAVGKVKKRKVIDLGSKIVLDTERCILCSRCVRFTDEVSQTKELGIFNRGDRSEIGVFKDRPLDNNYSLNTVDICPVGALTSKDFRFRQRVWYLKTADSICTGCSTGCNTYIDYNEEGLFRIRPRFNEKINQHWMCDKGRGLYQLPNPKGRLKTAILSTATTGTTGNQKKKEVLPETALKQVEKTFASHPSQTALILTAQYTTEEYEDLISFFLKKGGQKANIYYWKNNLKNFQNFDGVLLRGDQNPNTKGLLEVLEKNQILENNQGVNFLSHLEDQLKKENIHNVWVAGPENQSAYPDLKEKVKLLDQYCRQSVWWTAHPVSALDSNLKSERLEIPTKTFFEKSGHFTNYKGIVQKIPFVRILVPFALSLSDSVKIMDSSPKAEVKNSYLNTMKTNYWTKQAGSL